MSHCKKKQLKRKADNGRPPKPYDDFPLTPHPAGYWCKSIRGKVKYFGRWGKRANGKLIRIEGDGWQEALEEYERVKSDLYQGKTPSPKSEELMVVELCNRFLSAKLRQQEAGEITSRTFRECHDSTDRLVAAFGNTLLVEDLTASDFETLRANIAKRWGPVRLGNEIQRIRSIFKYGYESGIIKQPVRYCPQFKKPSKSVLRRHRATNGGRMFQADEIQALLGNAPLQVKSMVLLGVNCGFGNADCSSLPVDAIDLDKGWIRFPRPKTGIDRRCPLWPETIEALREAIKIRPKSKEESSEGLVFVTKYGKPWVRIQGIKRTPIDSVASEFGKLVDLLDMKHKGRGFYGLRHTFRTIADATRDFPAIRLIMGHADGSIDEVYREMIDDVRLQTVTDHVHQWLFGGPQDE